MCFPVHMFITSQPKKFDVQFLLYWFIPIGNLKRGIILLIRLKFNYFSFI